MREKRRAFCCVAAHVSPLPPATFTREIQTLYPQMYTSDSEYNMYPSDVRSINRSVMLPFISETSINALHFVAQKNVHLPFV